jgi:DNA-binding transcriptional regulator YiaG
MSDLPTMTAQELRDIRRTLRLTQAEAAPLFGVHLVTYKRWETEQSKANARSIPGPAVLLAQLYLKDHRILNK